MEYYVIINRECNLRCLYCYRRKAVGPSPSEDLLDATAKLILSREADEKVVTFHGGEPLLSTGTIRKLLALLDGNGIRFVLYTNGTLLEQTDPEILQMFDYLTVSVDGKEETHDKYRGAGTFATTMRNLRVVRPFFRGHIIGRMTLPVHGDVSLDSGIRELASLGLFDSITWQIENNASIGTNGNTRTFLEQYCKDLARLFECWCQGIEEGKTLNILPVQSVVRSLVRNEKHERFRCGCGWNLAFIDLTNDGRCYACDELVDSQRFGLGDVRNGIAFSDGMKHTIMNDNCSDCEIKYICGGRCVRSCLTFPEEGFRFYCSTVRAIVDAAKVVLPRVQHVLDHGTKLESLIHPATTLGEEIP